MIEIRRDKDGALDEVVCRRANIVHLEQMARNEWFLLIGESGRQVRIFLTSRGKIRASVQEEPVVRVDQGGDEVRINAASEALQHAPPGSSAIITPCACDSPKGS